MMSIAAQVRAAAEAAALAAAEAAAQAAENTKPRSVRLQPAHTPAPTVEPIQPSRVSPAAQQRRFLIASSAGAILAASGIGLDIHPDNDDSPVAPDVAKIVYQLQEDRQRLKDIKATERKVETKRVLLPAYRAWCDGVLAAGQVERGPLDQIFTTIMAWTIDVGDYVAAMPMIEHALRYGLDMPSHINRDPLTFAIDEICEEAIRVYDLADAPADAFDAAVLPMLQDMATDYEIDLHDEVEAKLQKALGRAIMAGANLEDEDDLRQRREQALKNYLRALEISPKVGVKKEIDRLQRDLKKTAPPVTDATSQAPASASTDAAPDATPSETDTPPPSDAG